MKARPKKKTAPKRRSAPPRRKNPGEPGHFYRSVMVSPELLASARAAYRDAKSPAARAHADGVLRVLQGGSTRWTGDRALERDFRRGAERATKALGERDFMAALHNTIELGGDAYSLIARRNPGRPRGAAARAEYKKTHWGEAGPRAARRLRVPDVRPSTTLVELGELVAVTYRTRKGGDVRTVNYHHDFKASDRPVLAYSADGKGLYIAGGSYRVTERGIEG